VRADGANVRLGAVRFLVNWRLVRLHDVSAEVQKALIAEVAPVRLDLQSMKYRM
jgi:hypothetical protein